MRILKTKIYTFNELNRDAQQVAIDSYKNKDGFLDYEWFDSVYETFISKIKDVGFDVDKIYFSGFWSQGDGAMFEYSDIGDKLLQSFIETLNLSPLRQKILFDLVAVSGTGVQGGMYYHENSCTHTTYFEANHGDICYDSNIGEYIEDLSSEFEDYVTNVYKELCGELYNALETDYNFLSSDETVKEEIIENDVEFEECGTMI